MTKRFGADRVAQVGAFIALFLLLSLFPLIIIVLSVLSFTSLTQTDNLSSILAALPADMAYIIQPILLDLIRNRSIVTMVLALLLGLWVGSNGVNSLFRAMESIYGIASDKSPLSRRIASFIYSIILTIAVVASLGIQVFGDQLIATIIKSNPILAFNQFPWNLAIQVIPILILLIGLTLLYKRGPGLPEGYIVYFSEAFLGATVATILWSIVSFGFRYFIKYFNSFAMSYGTILGIIIFILWLYLISVIIILGAQVTATFIRRRRGTLEEVFDELDEGFEAIIDPDHATTIPVEAEEPITSEALHLLELELSNQMQHRVIVDLVWC